MVPYAEHTNAEIKELIAATAIKAGLNVYFNDHSNRFAEIKQR